jgi:hypothetical protein
MGATHFLMKTLPRVATEMALHVLAQSHTRHEHRWHPTAHDGNAGIAIADARFALHGRTARPRASIPDNASMPRQHVFAQPRPLADLEILDFSRACLQSF